MLIREKAGIAKASSTPGKGTVATISEADVEEIAKIKMPDLNANDLEAAKQQVRGTARSMGIAVVITRRPIGLTIRNNINDPARDDLARGIRPTPRETHHVR